MKYRLEVLLYWVKILANKINPCVVKDPEKIPLVTKALIFLIPTGCICCAFLRGAFLASLFWIGVIAWL